MPAPQPPRVLIFGAGAIGRSAAAWLAPVIPELTLLARGEPARCIARDGIGARHAGQTTAVPVRVITELAEAGPGGPDLAVLITVKTYSLDAVCAQIRAALGDEVLAVGVQNGVENQRILPRHFPRAGYATAFYNAWLEGPAGVGFQKRGPLVIGGADPGVDPALKALAAAMNPGVPTWWTDRLRDVTVGKMVINLANSLTALLGFGDRTITDRAALKALLGGLMMDGVQVARAAGCREFKGAGMPPWLLLQANAALPYWLVKPLFEANMKKMVISSMGQDLARGGATELETINGALLAMADTHGVAAPTLRAVTALARERFAADPFEPMTPAQVVAAVDRHARERT